LNNIQSEMQLSSSKTWRKEVSWRNWE